MRFVKIVAGLLGVVIAFPASAQVRPEAVATLAAQRPTGALMPDTSTSAPVNISIPSAEAISAMTVAENSILIGAVKIEGSAALPQAEFSSIVEQFLGTSASGATLQSLARSVADRARERGYIFASAMVPQQEITLGIVRVKLDEGAVDVVKIIGSKNRKLRHILDQLSGAAATRVSLERYLLLAGDIPGIAIVRTRFEREAGRGVLIVEAREDRAEGQIWVDNFGSKAFGPLRARVQTDLTSLLMPGDSVTTQFLATPIDFSELAFASLRYAAPLGDDGATLALSLGAGRTRTFDPPSGIAINGRSKYGALTASYPLLRSNAKSLWLSGEVSALTVDQNALGELIQSDTIVTASLALSGQTRIGSARASGGFGLVQGLGGFGATGANDLLASRSDGSGKFFKAYGWAQLIRGVGKSSSIKLAASGQVASRPLLAAQELSVGGPGFGRGYDFSERFGDQGVLGLIEVRRDFENPIRHVQWIQLYGFADGGYVDNLKNGFGSGTLLSAGGGVRARVGPTELSFEAAAPINAMRSDSGNKDPRVNVAVGLHF
jgi:hemolysin activation/secretion protein